MCKSLTMSLTVGSTCHGDLNECSNDSLNSCMRSELAICVNTIGGYFCRCVRGYLQQNKQCVGKNICTSRITSLTLMIKYSLLDKVIIILIIIIIIMIISVQSELSVRR